ncbi:MAG: cbb3-type cytochrome c oxidase subunit 3 [bacterium]|jgi:hypothetical protein|nr:cbb3-type cytochrome c oxidase subunit 3 [bacterium]
MGLSAIMGHAGLSGYAIVAMLLFIAVFASLMVRLWRQGRSGRLEEAGRLPLDDGRLATLVDPSTRRRKEG